LVKLRNTDTHALLGSDWHEAFAAASAALAQFPAAQPAPPAAPAGGLVDEICRQLPLRPVEIRAVIREVAAWLDSNDCLPDDATPREADGWEMAAQILNREADQ
jgi:hypothetical protein